MLSLGGGGQGESPLQRLGGDVTISTLYSVCRKNALGTAVYNEERNFLFPKTSKILYENRFRKLKKYDSTLGTT